MVINIKFKFVVEQIVVEDYVNLEIEKEKNGIYFVEVDKSNDVLVEMSGEIIILLREIQFYYSESENDVQGNFVDDNMKEIDK